MLWKVFRVSGDSMSPTIVNGDYVLAGKYKSNPNKGNIAVIEHPSLGILIKRIDQVGEDGKAFVSGDNDFSTPQRIIGPIYKDWIKYQVRWRISPFGLYKLKK